VVTALAVLVFAFEWHNGQYAVIFLMATHSAFFAPAKYGVIPELAGSEQLSRANGLIESFTYLAIIFGTTLASALAQFSRGRYWVTGIFCLLVAIAGLWAASRVGETPRADPQRQIAWFPAEILRTILELRTDRDILFAITGQAYFMFVGAYTQLNLIGYGIQEIGLVESRSGYLFLAAALGIGIGSIAAARISGRDVETGLVPVGAIGLVLALFLLQAVQPGLVSCIVIVVILGISAGIFSLPLQTYIQLRANPLKRGEVLAAASFVNWVAILVASGFTWLFSGPMGLRPAQGFGAVGAVTLIFSLAFFWWMPGLRHHFLALISRSGGRH
jgi:acyl-[acyl-carrier-protein]-phospholipid O-acyltransferase/long-chain-fatty-acid--[acyl-carrier-protein] ligase